MSSTTKKSFLRGVRDGAPFLLVVGPFALLFGVVATEAGLSVVETMGFSILVIAGASQFTAVQLMVDQAPTVMVLAAALAVNLRMAMYSASLTPHLGRAGIWTRALVSYFNVDQTYALAIARYEREPAAPVRDKIAYFFGTAAPVCPFWYVFTLVGALGGEAIPPGLALDFALPITFLALIAPMLKSLAHVAAALTSAIVALALAWLPSGLSLLIAAGTAMTVGALVEMWQERQSAWT
ncbi:AzlC family ABC transporter permease [Roseitranquillus sediminis]|uniref:AzlC family ABC transporter permease n=1 Tax=Roseitranquillus sediminis TaxID=2809051 RepID=UPI001D0C1BE4|nr:AzlC family ABC transporter permease [Roseitranquillus sediminis]MBM9593330.1 AzlC family ABC transporter permease [Roseitranquillus sediminis]